MNILGISVGFHDAAISIVDNRGEILFAAHSERYSKIKHDANLSSQLVKEIATYQPFDTIAYYEKPFIKIFKEFTKKK